MARAGPAQPRSDASVACEPSNRSTRPAWRRANLRECLLLQIESGNGKGGVAWQIVSNHMRLLETRQFKELAKVLGTAAGTHRYRHRA